MNKKYEYDEGCIAVIGMAARLPGAGDINEFWENLTAGRQSMEPIPDEALAAGLHARTRHAPDYVAMRSTLRDYDLFDADFFGFSPRDASVMDPQHRLVLEYGWRAFENAGYEPRDGNGIRTGVYASSDMSGYLTGYLYHHILSGTVDVTEAVIGCDKDYLATRIAYKCDLKGPAMAVQSSCSSSLLSVHVACQALLAGECDRALVTACTVMLPENLGYIYLPGGMRSPDGRCRPYDADANGTIFANGVIAVLFKRLADAQKDKDNILAVVRATAAANDGFDKVGYAAPSVNGQADAISAALSLAGVEPQDVDFIEGHGTATPLGDPIEVAALKKAYGSRHDGLQHPIMLGSLKGNIGHLDAAAGLASFAKAALCLRHAKVPGTANFITPNPAFGDLGPFAIRQDCVSLPAGGASLLGGVSAFGIGGTNVHAILQDAPAVPERKPNRARLPLLFSAHNDAAFALTRERLAANFSGVSDTLPLEDAAFTLAVGRRHQALRGALMARTAREASQALAADSLHPRVVEESGLPVAFLFPGQGNLHPRMAQTFYAEEADFRHNLGELSALSVAAGGPDIADLLKRCWKEDPKAVDALTETETAQPLLFALELALAQTLLGRGIRPACMIGHSLGEYAAACVAGVFSAEDGMRLIVRRGALMQSAPRGKMLVVSLHASRVREVLGPAFDGVEISLINSTANCVLTGPEERLRVCAEVVAEHGQRATWLKTSHAFHSASMETIMEPFREIMRGMDLRKPEIPYVSNLTGTWIGDEAASPDYWVKHLRGTVQFAGGLSVLHERARVGIEVGPGNVLRSLASQQLGGRLKTVPGLDPLGVSATGATPADLPERTLADIGADVWLLGGDVDWQAYYSPMDVRRVPLPETAFTPRRYWINPGGSDVPGAADAGEMDKYARSCRDACIPPDTEIERTLVKLWQELLFVDHIGIRDDFLELGGNSIQVMQMVRQAAGMGLNFTSKDVFEAGNIQELAKRVHTGKALREATPGPVPIPAYLALPLADGGDRTCHYRLFICPDNFNLTQAGDLARTLASRHDALRMSWVDGSLRLAGAKEVDWALNNVDDLRAIAAETPGLPDDIMRGDCAAPAARLQPERLKAWSLTLLPGENGGAPRLLLLVRAAIADMPSMSLLEQDILQFMRDGSLPSQPGGSWKLWLEDLAAAEAPDGKNSAGHASGNEDAAKPSRRIFGEPGQECDRSHIDATSLDGAHLRLEKAAATCRSSVEELLAAALGLCLGSDEAPCPFAHFMNDGRHLITTSANPVNTVGSFALRHAVSVIPGMEAGEAIPHFKEALRAIAQKGTAPWLKMQNRHPADITFFWMGNQAHGHAEPGTGPALLQAGSWRPPSCTRGSAVELICWAEKGNLRARLVYPPLAGEQGSAFLRTFMAKVETVAEAGMGDSHAARYVVADFADSDLSPSDLDVILSQING
ncbi:MAG: hypothetical protein BCS36_06625 [Desulfovibrio sp. MES5]|uniref:type I polyketide synthase n=1 Tax=Desulfovibrio sp. MES5 TaxID=1899016 RepID=UPI000B9CCBB6|nr:beta-ketoacyl synthase N-terminal-like domain-containing protein [Desulfovibrio sp. MES5]OXS30142.1 MAG: hypothetical protein BCS36_06625 [Desulfovibrio sp. MES5]